MAVLVEDVPRVELAQIRNASDWPALTAAGGVELTLRIPDGDPSVHRIQLVSDQTPWGKRWWLVCPARCGRKCLHLYIQTDGNLSCRQCWGNGQGLLYYQQTLATGFREEVGVPTLRQQRALNVSNHGS